MDHIFITIVYNIHMHIKTAWSKGKENSNRTISKRKRYKKKAGWLGRKKGLVRD